MSFTYALVRMTIDMYTTATSAMKTERISVQNYCEQSCWQHSVV